MAKSFTLRITTPETEFYSGEVESLIITTTEGKRGVLPRHILMVVSLDIAPISFKTAEGWQVAALSGGFAQIKGNEVLVLSDSAEWPDKIDVERALEAKKRAEERLRSELTEVEFMRSQVALRRALTRLEVVRRH